MEIEQQLRAALMPRSPGPAMRAAVMARVKKQARGRSRPLLWGCVLMVAAAAAMLAIRLAQGPAVPSVDASIRSAMPDAPAATPLQGVGKVVPAEQASPALHVKPEPAAASTPPFTISMQLQNQATGQAAGAVDAFYRVLLDSLRTVPGVLLVDPTQQGAPRADRALTLTGSSPQAGMFVVNISEVRVTSSGGISQSGFGTRGEVSPSCTGTVPCNDPAGLAASVMEYLRSHVLPSDPAYMQQLQARMLDPRQEPQLRFNALKALLEMSHEDAVKGPLSPALLRGVIDLSKTALEPEMRAEIWRLMRGSHMPEIVPALEASMRDDESTHVRIEALATLGGDFRGDPGARAAMEKMARDDSSPLLQALAQWTLTGDTTAWRQHIIASLQDTSLPPARRIEAFAYHMYGTAPGSSSTYSAGDPRFLDDEVIAALAKALPAAMKLPEVGMLKYSLMSNLLATRRPAGIATVLDMVKDDTDATSRPAMIKQLAQASSNPAVRAALEDAKANDADPRRRETATEVLASASPAAGAPPSPGSGIDFLLDMVRQNSDPKVRAAIVKGLAEGAGRPGVRESLEKIRSGDPDPAMRDLAADALKAAQQ